jgi:hypothetical protein
MKTYLVKKDMHKPCAEDNWIIMNGYEFARFMETAEGQMRKKNFAKLNRCGGRDDDIIVECGTGTAREWERGRLRELYRACANAAYASASFDRHSHGLECSCGEEDIADPDADVEKAVIRQFETERLYEALRRLSAEEMELVELLFLADETMTESEYAAFCGICQSTAHWRKGAVLAKLKIFLEESGFGTDFFA